MASNLERPHTGFLAAFMQLAGFVHVLVEHVAPPPFFLSFSFYCFFLFKKKNKPPTKAQSKHTGVPNVDMYTGHGRCTNWIARIETSGS